MSDLDARILAAHDAGDPGALAELYCAAADQADDEDAECFFLVAAYVFALESDHPQAAAIHTRLKDKGREE